MQLFPSKISQLQHREKGAGKDLISLPALSKQDLSLALDLQVLKAVLADGVFHPAGISLSRFLIHAGLYKHFSEKQCFS